MHCVLILMPLSAAFGAEITDPLLGYVIPLSSFTVPCNANFSQTVAHPENSGCPDLCLSDTHAPTETWIALVQRGKCEFVKKVREAQRLGAKAVVIGGEDPDISGYPDTLVNMYSPGVFSNNYFEVRPPNVLEQKMRPISILQLHTLDILTIWSCTPSYLFRIRHTRGCTRLRCS